MKVRELTERQFSAMRSFARSSNDEREFTLGLTSGPNGSMWPSLEKRGFVEVLHTTIPACECCGRGPTTVSVGHITDAGAAALAGYERSR